MYAPNEVLKMSPHAPTPEEAEHAIWLFKFWKELLGFVVGSLTLTLAFFKLKQKTIIPMSVEEIEHRLKIREQDIMLQLNTELNARDSILFAKIQEQSDRTISYIKAVYDK